MLSTDRGIKRLVFLTCTCLASAVAAHAQTTTLGCPETITVTEAATPMKGWNANGGRVDHPFERVSIYNGKDGDREFELAPDAQKESSGKVVQTWNLSAYRTMNIFLRCRYRDTPVGLSKTL